jgi:hypothetical protein
MYGRFEYITDLQYKTKSLQAQVDAFCSGEKYIKMHSGFQNRLAKKDREIKNLKQELAAARRGTISAREHWMRAMEDLEKEHAAELCAKERAIKKMEERALLAERRLDELRDKFKEKAGEIYAVKTELDEEREKNTKLLARLNRDHENSSMPSSLKIDRKKITNNRERTGKKPGGQPGHEGHGRKKQTPAREIFIPAPEYEGNPNFRKTGRRIRRQMNSIHIALDVVGYVAEEYRNQTTGQRVHARFPDGVANDVNYDGSIKAFLFLLNNYCDVSIDKARGFLSDLTDGALEISKGMINGLSKEFAGKTKDEQEEIFSKLVCAPVLNIDFTAARVNGRHVNVFVCATPERAAYCARKHKGHEGIKGTPAELNPNTFVHDHDKTFYSYGGNHQECDDHALRYLLGSMQNEKELTWNTQMHELLREMIHYRKGLGSNENLDAERVAELEKKYDGILDLADSEYEYEPPSKYYRDGYNLCARLRKYKRYHLLFLHDKTVPPDNNLSERLLRVYKRKQKQVMAFRSFDSLDYLCQSMTMMASLRASNENLYKSVAAVFD